MSDKNQPMDAKIAEAKVGSPHVNSSRVCGAIKQLVAEVGHLFPETPVEYSNYDGRKTALAVTFDLTAMDGGDSVILNNLLDMIETDARVNQVITADYDQSFVDMRSSGRTQDSRESFGLEQAYLVLVETDADESGYTVEAYLESASAAVAEAWGSGS